jgi:hypothetical protein
MATTTVHCTSRRVCLIVPAREKVLDTAGTTDHEPATNRRPIGARVSAEGETVFTINRGR